MDAIWVFYEESFWEADDKNLIFKVLNVNLILEVLITYVTDHQMMYDNKILNVMHRGKTLQM